ncbi:hypothetical protein NYZ64_16620, partial [Acinetobacter baumannii]|nr:hypothetical protein [Acinetobacter baumannii]
PVGCTISFRSRFIHFEIIGLNKPYRLGLCNKADRRREFSKLIELFRDYEINFIKKGFIRSPFLKQ